MATVGRSSGTLRVVSNGDLTNAYSVFWGFWNSHSAGAILFPDNLGLNPDRQTPRTTAVGTV